MDITSEAELLRKVPMFAKLDTSKLKLLAFTSQSVSLEDGEELFHMGDPGDCAYVILSGQAEFLVSTTQGEVVGGTMAKNELFGELAIFTNSARTATIRARGHLEALRIDEDMFLKLIGENSTVALEIMRQLSEKVTRTHRRLEQAEEELLRFQSEKG